MDSTFSIFPPLLWTLILPIYAYGLGSFFVKCLSLDCHIVLKLSLGFALSGIIQSFLLLIEVPPTLAYPLLLSFGILYGLIDARNFKFIFVSKQTLYTRGVFISLIAILLITSYLRMLTPNGGAESFQYHYFLPKLFNEQRTLFLSGFELYEVLLNVWSNEVLLSFSEFFGGLHFMLIQSWWLYVLFILQVCLSSKWLFPKSNPFWVALFILLSSFYSYLLWWSKPELSATGYCAITFAYLIKSKQNQTFKNALILGILFVWLLSLKITCTAFIPIPFIILLIFYKKSLKWIASIIGITSICFIPWLIFIFQHKGSLGALPTENSLNFSAPITSGSIIYAGSVYTKYFEDLIMHFKLFKPSIYFFLIGLPVFIRYLHKYWLICSGILFNLIFAFVLIKDSTPFADEFRYTCFTLFVIPMGAGVVCTRLFEFKFLKTIMILFAILISGQRAYIQNSETLRYHKSYLLGQQTLKLALAKEGSLQYSIYLEKKGPNHDKLLHLGNGNYAVHGEDVIHVNSWSKKYPLWKNKNPESMILWLHNLGVKWVLLERWRYESFANGFGGQKYVDSPMTAYYRETLNTLNAFDQYLVSGSDSRYSLYYFPNAIPISQ